MESGHQIKTRGFDGRLPASLAVSVLVGCLLAVTAHSAQVPSAPSSAAPTNSHPPAASDAKASKPGASNSTSVPNSGTKAPADQPGSIAGAAVSTASLDSEEGVPSEDWAVQLLDAMANGPSGDAHDALLDAAFAAGPDAIPQLQAALKDDRTAEFAAQALAYVGGGEALKILAGLVDDPRDLDLRRFYLAALGEYQAPESSKILVYAMNHADDEPDRSVTEAAILALTVQADVSMIPELQAAQKKIKDPVLHDDLENAIAVIQTRAQFLARANSQPGGSVDDAVRTYFLPALEPPRSAESTGGVKAPRTASGLALSSTHSAVRSTTLASAARAPHAVSRPPGTSTGAKSVQSEASKKLEGPPGVKVEIQSLTFSPKKERALARVLFETPDARAYYDLVLQKREGNWNVASVWLDSEEEKAGESPKSKVESRE